MIPQPPKLNRELLPEDLPLEPMPLPPPLPPKPSAKLTDDETMFIMRTTLNADHFANDKVIKFILHYFVHRNAAEAARVLGMEKTWGTYLRQRPDVHNCIEQMTTKAVMKYGFDATELVERTKEIAFIDPIEFQNPDGSFKTHMSEIRVEARMAIKKFKAKNIWEKDTNGIAHVIGQLIEVEVWDKIKAQELLGREKNVFKETKKVEHDHTVNMGSILLGSTQRADQRMLTVGRSPDVIETTARPVIEGRVDGEVDEQS